MAWYDDKKRTSYVAEYKDAKAVDDDAKKAGPKGWTIVSTTGEDGKVRVVGTLAKGALTGGIGLLVFGRSRRKAKVIVSWQRVVEVPSASAPSMVPAQPALQGVPVDAQGWAIGPGGVPMKPVTVVGVGAYQSALSRIVGSSQLTVATAELRREPNNKYNAKAVQVLIARNVVGYLPMELDTWSPALESFRQTFSCPAEVRGTKGALGVRIFLPDLE